LGFKVNQNEKDLWNTEMNIIDKRLKQYEMYLDEQKKAYEDATKNK